MNTTGSNTGGRTGSNTVVSPDRIRRFQPSDKAWITLAAGVFLWDMLAPANQTLSEGADRYLVHHKWLTRFVGVSLVAHVCNFVTPQWDWIHWLFTLSRRWRRP